MHTQKNMQKKNTHTHTQTDTRMCARHIDTQKTKKGVSVTRLDLAMLLPVLGCDGHT